MRQDYEAVDLVRRLGAGDAVVLGLGAMLGAGVFTVVAPAARAAGPWLLVALVLAAGVAWCNATSSADLAAAYPEAGGTYVYGRERLGPGWGFLAGWAFIVGKVASCATAGLAFGTYVLPAAPRFAGAAAVAALATANATGVEKTLRATRLLLAIVLGCLAVSLAASLARSGGPVPGAFRGSFPPYGTLRAAGLLFFAFAGYARIATLAGEVRDPGPTIRKAVPRALGIALAVYAVVAVVTLLALGPDRLGSSTAPVADAVRAGRAGGLAVAARVGAAVATLSVLLSVLAGLSRTAYAMGRRHDLPSWLGVAHPGWRTPARAEFATAAAAVGLVAAADLVFAVGLSAFTVLLYYAVANASALRLPRAQRRWSPWYAGLGLVGCLVLAATLPTGAVITGGVLLVAGVLARSVAGR